MYSRADIPARTSALILASALSMALAPAAAQATIEEGHPEAYDNGALVGNHEHAAVQEGYGEIHLASKQLGPEGIECVNLGFGTAFNEGSPLRAQGQIMSWVAAGHAPSASHPQLGSYCRPESTKGFATDEAPVALEENEHHEVEPNRRTVRVPWNVELLCGAREEEFTGIVRIGVPNSEFPKSGATPCPETAEESSTLAEYEAYKKEREEKKGCYVTNPAPEGCIHVVMVEPGAGLEVAFGGTLWAHAINGVKNGLTPSRWVFEEKGGELQCERPEGCTATGTDTGEVKVLGYNGIELMQAR